MLVRDVMTTEVVTVGPDTSTKEAVQRLDAHEITAMPVVGARGLLLGVISEADVIRESVIPDRRVHETPVRLTGRPVFLRVRDLMTHLPLTVRPDDDLARAVELLVDTQVKSLPVVADGRVVGMVSRRDVIKVMARQDPLIESEVDDLLRSAEVEFAVEVVDGVVRLEGPSDPHLREIARVLAASVPGVVAVALQEPGKGHASTAS